ncbi:MAG: Wzt carbohydrate-binding domain-containing protein [Thiolinea sp.]
MIERLPLLAGEYCLEVWLIDASGVHVYDARERCCHFRVRQSSQQQGVGLCWLAHHWQVKGKIASLVPAEQSACHNDHRESKNVASEPV